MINVPKVSVIMPVYNTANYLNEAIDSILNQSFTDFEFIIVDDCSNDGSLEIIKSYKDKRIVLIENEVNKGYVFGLNYAISISKGEFIARMDSDDISDNKRLEIQYSFMLNNKGVLVCGTNIGIIGSSKVVKYPENHDEIKRGLLTSNVLAHPSVIMRKSSFNLSNSNEGPYINTFVPSEDYELWTTLIFKGKFHNLQQELLRYRVHEKQISNVQSRIQYQNFLMIKRKYIIEYFSKKKLLKREPPPFEKYTIKENRDFVIIQKIMTRRELKNEIECLKILKDELNSIRKNIFEKREMNSMKGVLLLIQENPKIFIFGDKIIVFAYLKRVLKFTLMPSARIKSIYLN